MEVVDLIEIIRSIGSQTVILGNEVLALGRAEGKALAAIRESAALQVLVTERAILLAVGIEGDEPRDRTYTGDFILDEKHRTAWLTEEGESRVEEALGISNINELVNYEVKHGVEQSLKAYALFQRDKDYVVKDGQVVSDELKDRLEMLQKDIQVYGRLLADQRSADLAGSAPSFLAQLRK